MCVSLSLDVAMVKSARQASTGDGVCIGLTYNGNAFGHPETSQNKDLSWEAVDEIKSHEAFKHTVNSPHSK